MTESQPLIETFGQMLREQLPNLFRLYLNPFVAQTCFCLGRYVQTTWPEAEEAEYQSFVANGFDEALGGAIKLARYSASVDGRPATGLVIDSSGRLGPFAGAPAAGGAWVEFLPGLVVVRHPDELRIVMASEQHFGFVALVPTAVDALDEFAEPLRELVRRDAPRIITCVERTRLAALRSASGVLHEMTPDIVVFDESFVERAVPFAAFTARRTLYDHWNLPGKTTFHSTTFQPNTISSLHFMRCLLACDPAFYREIAVQLDRITSDLGLRAHWFRRLYSPSLGKAIRSTGFETADIRATGEFVHAAGRKVFDCVGGVACSNRGHNPSSYLEEIKALPNADECRAELASRLRDLTGLECVLPAVSGATAVENALKLALIVQYPKRHVLALKSGFGGKTLFALTGTWSAVYKERIAPLYGDVLYVDPFAPDSTAQIDKALSSQAIAVVQVELIQGVGGVRRVPENVIRHLHARRETAGYLLLVDEIQTGMYRTGPFTQSTALGLTPDLLVLGKGVSDMMFPFALLTYSATIREKLDSAGSDLPAALEKRYGYEYGYRTALNVLRRADELGLSVRTTESGALFEQLLRNGLTGCKAVREVRVHGLLIGIELDTTHWPRRWLRKRLFQIYLLAMLRHRRYPVLVGFCQYEPHVLKITPPLTMKAEDVRAVCATIIEVLKRPMFRLLATILGGLIRSVGIWRRKREHVDIQAHEPVPR